MTDGQQVLFSEHGLGETQGFRLIHYLGAKSRAIPVIKKVVSEIVGDGAHICDLFSGSGAVSMGLRDRWAITAVDMQEYSRVLCSAVLNPPRPDRHDPEAAPALRAALRWALEPVIQHEQLSIESAARGSLDSLCEILEAGSLCFASSTNAEGALRSAQESAIERLKVEGLDAGAVGVVSRYFGGVYFAWSQAIELDCLLANARVAHQSKTDQLIAATLSCASDIVNTVGKQFAQPIRPRDSRGVPKAHLIRQTIRDRTTDVHRLHALWLDKYRSIPTARHPHVAQRGDFAEVLQDVAATVDLVYADPPYTRDHYSRYYHVLETMARGDEPAVSTTMIRTGGVAKPSRGLYRDDRHQSPFCIKSQAPGAFRALMQVVKDAKKPLVLSYSPYKEANGNRPRLLTMTELTDLAREHFAQVEVIDVGGVSHNKLNLSARNARVDYAAEVLLICRS